MLGLALVGLTAVITFVSSRAWGLATGSSILDLAVAVVLGTLAFEAAWKMLEAILLSRMPARSLPAMDFDGGVPDEAATLVCVPVLLTSTEQVDQLVRRLEGHWRNEPDRNVRFGLLTDWLDSDREDPSAEEAELLHRCATLVEELNRGDAVRGLEPFYLLHRARAWSPGQRCWMGHGRKAGKLQALNRFIADGSNEFALVIGRVTSLRSTRYVLVLDEDTSASPNAIRRHDRRHPSSSEPREPSRSAWVRGSADTASWPARSWPARTRCAGWRRPGLFLQAQPVASDGASSRPLRNGFFDLFGQRMFAGKGIYDVPLARQLLDDRFPPERMLSHDVMEGGILRTAFFDRATLLDDFPASYSSYCARLHRWIRGDWQNLGLLLRRRTGAGRARPRRRTPRSSDSSC